MQKIHLTKIYRSDRDKEGKPFIGKNSGKPYTKISIKCIEYGDRWIGGFGNAENSRWNEGDEVIVKIVENGQYLNFERVSELEIVNAKLDEILSYIRADQKVDYLTGQKEKEKAELEPEITSEDIPF